MKRLGLSLLSLIVLSTSALGATKTDIDRVIAVGQEENRVMDHLDILCNRFGPRLTSSDALQTANQWARDTFESFGLTNARLEEWGEFPVGFNRGPWFGKVVEPQEKRLEFLTMSWSAGTKGAVRAKAVLAPTSEEELEALRADLKGAWVFSPNAARGGPVPSAEFQSTLYKIYGEIGVAGVVRSSRGTLLITSGNSNVSWDKLPTTPSVVLLQTQFDEILGLLKDKKPVVVEFDIRNYFKKGPIKQYNVIADIPGTETPDEYVIVGGHIDSWDGATGATDNGTGVSTTLEAARILMKSGVKPKRTIRFMLFSGEEQGLLGSLAYVKAHPELMPKISAVLVHDGGTNYLSGIGATTAMLSDLQQVFNPVLSLNPKLPFEVKEVPALFGGGSDHESFLGAGVPGFFWYQAGDANYTHTHHTQFDTYDAAVSDYQKHSSIVAAVGALGIADLDHLLSREKLRVATGGGNRRMLGIQLDELTINEVLDDGVAKKAGAKPGDVIVSIDGKKVSDRMQLVQAVNSGEPKKKLVVIRDGKEVELLLEWPAPPKPKPKDESETKPK